MKAVQWVLLARKKPSPVSWDKRTGFSLRGSKWFRKQGQGLRCDRATSNIINPMAKISDKLQLLSDLNVPVITELGAALFDRQIAGRVLDERKAYRQLAMHPDDRNVSIICIEDPSHGNAKFFVMIGHSFGLGFGLQLYNRRSSAINEIIEKISLVSLVAFNFFDDRYGFKPNRRTRSRLLSKWLKEFTRG